MFEKKNKIVFSLEIKPSTCPVCNGSRVTAPGLYAASSTGSIQPNGTYDDHSGMISTCYSCNGTGIVWPKLSE